jgi:hypothetical protein
MSFKMTLGFTGLCAFVPHDSGTRARVLLLGGNTEDGGNGSNGNHAGHGAHAGNGNGMGNGHGDPHSGHAMETHHPVIVFDKRQLSPTSARKPDISFFSEEVEMGLCFLTNQDVEILSDSASGFSMLGIDGANENSCPLPTGRDQLSWVAPIEKILPGSGAPAAACFGSTGVPAAIGARIRLTQGTLRNGKFGFNTKGLIQWQFEPFVDGPAGHHQALSEVVELDLDVPGNEVSFSTTRFRGTKQPPQLTLIPMLDADGVLRVSAVIKCMPLEDILGTRPTEEVRVGTRRERDEHFEHYFRISDADPGVGKGLVPKAVAICENGPPTVHSPQCPPTLFKASSAA